MKNSIVKFLFAALLSLGLVTSSPLYAGISSQPDNPQTQSPATQSVQPEVDKTTAEKANEKRKKILADAKAAINETRNALQALENNNTGEALTALEKATGKLELILARDPSMALAPVDVKVVSHDLVADTATIKAMIRNAENYLEDGDIQKARSLVSNLASEIVINTTSIPLASYPDAIKAITPLIDEGKLDEARSGLQLALKTLVVTTDEVIPLPLLRAQQLLAKAEEMAEKEARTAEDNDAITGMLAAAKSQLKMAELLGYGTKKSFKPMYEQLGIIEDNIAGSDSSKGLFDRIKQQVSALL